MNNLNTKIRFIESTEEFAACAAPWNELAGNRLFHRWEWMFHWWEAFQGEGQLAIMLIADEDDRWLGVAPWYKTTTVGRGREVKVLGSGQACSDYVSLAIRDGFDEVVLPIVAQVMNGTNGEPNPYQNVDSFELEGHAFDDRWIQQLVHCHQDQAMSIHATEIGATWCSPLADSWQEFESQLHKSFRRKTKKASKRLRDPQFSSLICTDPDSIRENWPIFVKLHQARRQSLGQPGCFADPRFEQFLFKATTQLSAAGLSQINLIKYHNQPITANLEYSSGDTLFMYQTGMDPSHLALEPGHINFTAAIQQAIARGFKSFDFLRGDEPYKARWNARRRPLYRTHLVPRRLSSLVRHGVWTAGRNLKDLTRSVFGNAVS